MNIDKILWLVAAELCYQTKWHGSIWVFIILEVSILILFGYLVLDKIINFINNKLK